MKSWNVSLILIILLFGTSCSNDDDANRNSNILDGNLVIKRQSELDSIGELNLLRINGDLILEPAGEGPVDEIVNTGPLSGLEEINGDLIILTLRKLKNIDGLSDLRSVGGSIEIRQAPMNGDSHGLENIDGLSGIKEIPGALILNGLPNLQNLDGLSNLTSVGGKLEFNPFSRELSNISGFSNLESIGGSFKMTFGFTPNRISLQPLSNLTSIGNSLEIVSCRIQSLEGLEGITSVPGRLEINSLDMGVNDLRGLENITTIGESYEGEVADFEILGIESLTTLNGIQNIQRVEGRVLIGFNSNLTDYCALEEIAQNDGISDRFFAGENRFNPTLDDIRNGDCRL